MTEPPTAPDPEPRELAWARQLQAIAQAGLTYARDPFDVERYEAVHRIAAEMLAGPFGLDAGAMLAVLERQDGYPTPKVDLRGVVFCGDELLLVQERSDGRWTLPGGWADVEESPREGVEREVREESGFEVRATRLLAVYDRQKQGYRPPFPFHVYKLFIACALVGGEAAPSAETAAVGFFREDALPPLSETRVRPHQLARMFALHRRPHAPPDFD